MIEKRPQRSDMTGVVLAGGKSSRMGCEKALLTLDDYRSLIEATGGKTISRTPSALYLCPHES